MPLTVKQDKFARMVADGVPRNAAYAKAGYGKGSKPTTKMVDAQRLSRQPNVREAIVEYEKESLALALQPFEFTATALRAHGVKQMVRMSLGSDPVAYKAAEWLAALADKLEQAEQKDLDAADQSQVVKDLRKLYKEALAAQAPLVVEAAPDESPVIDAQE